MVRRSVARLLAAAVLLSPGAVSAREWVVDYQEVVRLASERAPAVIAARGRIAEAAGRRAGAAVRLTDNPELQVLAGPRRRDGASTIDFEVTLGQTFRPGGRRGARIAAADAGIARERAGAADTARLVVRDAALAYHRALAGAERVRLAQQAEAIAVEALAVAEKRLARGDLVELDVRLARAALARARSAVSAAEADGAAALGELAALLALEPGDTVRVRGDLAARRPVDAAGLRAAAGRRPDLLALDAERREGEAEARLGRGAGWPDLGLQATWAREEEADILLGGITITLPLFERGQEQRAVGRARAVRARSERAARERAVGAELHAALAVHRARLAAVTEIETGVLPLQEESERLLRRGFETGQIDMAQYLVARRELLDARAEYVDRLLELAVAAVEVEAAAGVLP